MMEDQQGGMMEHGQMMKSGNASYKEMKKLQGRMTMMQKSFSGIEMIQ